MSEISEKIGEIFDALDDPRASGPRSKGELKESLSHRLAELGAYATPLLLDYLLDSDFDKRETSIMAIQYSPTEWSFPHVATHLQSESAKSIYIGYCVVDRYYVRNGNREIYPSRSHNRNLSDFFRKLDNIDLSSLKENTTYQDLAKKLGTLGTSQVMRLKTWGVNNEKGTVDLTETNEVAYQLLEILRECIEQQDDT